MNIAFSSILLILLILSKSDLAMKKHHDQLPQTCSFCGEKTACESKKTQAFGQGEKLLVSENVPTITCENCGENYMTGAALDLLDEIISNRQRFVHPRLVEVAEFT